jgi:hypothetical protein
MALTFTVASFSLNSCRQKDVIKEDVLSQIYAEMLMTDQWINSTAGLRLVADTSLVYEPILKKYGYTSADYRNSVEHYLKDPEEYADIMSGTVKILDERLAELRKLKEEQQRDKERQDFIKKLEKETDFSRELKYVYKITDERHGIADSVFVVWDSLSYCYAIAYAPWSERKASADSLSSTDSLPQLDSLHLSDSLKALDRLHDKDTAVFTDSVKKKIPVNRFDLSNIKKGGSLNVSDSLTKVK